MLKGSKKLKIAKTTPCALEIFWEHGFFRAVKKNAAAVDRLSVLGYNFSQPELGMALMRAKYLTRKGRKGNYEYIQKHPYFKENEK